MPRFRRRPEFVSADQFKPDEAWPACVTAGPDGVPRMNTGSPLPFKVRPGNWILTFDNGIRIQMRPEDFEATYEPVD